MECENCNRKINSSFTDRVSNKLICGVCKKFAIDSGVRFEYDFDTGKRC